jgi:ATP-dependent Zn protease
LKNPEKYTNLEVKFKRSLTCRASRNRKNLISKAVAGEAQVPFSLYQDLIFEMFVGVGASRVRDLFKQRRNLLLLFS